MKKTKPNSCVMRVPLEAMDDLKWIQANMKDQLVKPSYARIMELAVKCLRAVTPSTSHDTKEER